jgi:two-component system, NtrC family, response regulator HydG
MPRILLIEDDANVRMVMEHALVDGGYEVDTAATVSVGYELLATRLYDLVVADARMPDGSGIELADKAREVGSAALIITGYAFNLPRDDLDRFEFLLKPVRPSELLHGVERVLQTARI